MIADKPVSRSYEDLGPGQQLYSVIESCTDPQTLWAKIDSGHWDWLGVEDRKGKRKYVLGRPRLARLEGFAMGTKRDAGVADDSPYRVEVQVPGHAAVGGSVHGSREDAEAQYERTLTELTEPTGSALYRVALRMHGEVVRSEFVVRVLPNRL